MWETVESKLRGKQRRFITDPGTFRAWKILCMILYWWRDGWMSIIHLSKLTECRTPRVNPNNVNYGFGVIMMCQWRFINCNKCTFLVGMLINREHMWGAGDTWQISVLSSQWCCEPKTPLKKLSLNSTTTNQTHGGGDQRDWGNRKNSQQCMRTYEFTMVITCTFVLVTW